MSVNAAPDGFKIFDFHIPMEVMARFYEEQPALQDLDINIALLHSSVKNACIIVTQQPPFRANAPRRKKMQANEIRDAIDMQPHLRRKFEFITFLNKYDVMCMIKNDLLMQPAIQELKGMGDLLVISATSHQRIRAKDVVRAVQPPYALVRFSPSFAVEDVLKSVSIFGPVENHQLFQQAGTLFIRYQADTSADTVYGATLPGPVYLTSGTPARDATLTLEQRLASLDLASLPSPDLNESNLATIPTALTPFGIPDFTPPVNAHKAASTALSSAPPLGDGDAHMSTYGSQKRARDEPGDQSFPPPQGCMKRTHPCQTPLNPYVQPCQCFAPLLSLDSLFLCRLSSMRRGGLPETTIHWVPCSSGAMPQ